jgi:hypothetical protein
MKLMILSVDHINPGTIDHLKAIYDPTHQAKHIEIIYTENKAKKWHVEAIVDEWEQDY